MTYDRLTRQPVSAEGRERQAWTRTAALAGALALLIGAPPLARPGRTQDAPSVRQLSDNVKNEDARVRSKALKALATKGPEALEPLSVLVGDPVRGIREDAIPAVLGIFVQPPAKKRVQSAEDAFDWSPFRTSPWPLPPQLVPNLVHDLSDDWPSVRRDAVYALGVVLTPPVDTALGDELIYSLADPDGAVRLAAVRAVGRLHVTRAGDTLIGRIGDPELPVRLAAMRAIGDLREARALVALQEQLEFYKSGSAGRAALDALARIAHPSSVGLFAEYRRSNNEDLRRYAYEGLGRLGNISDGDAAVFESRLSEERHAVVIGAIAFALATTSRPHLDRIVEALPNPDTVDQAREYLVELGRAHPDTLLPYLQNPNPDVREQVAMIVGVVGGDGAEAALTPLTTDTSEAVRRAAQVAITRLRVPAQRPEPR